VTKVTKATVKDGLLNQNSYQIFYNLEENYFCDVFITATDVTGGSTVTGQSNRNFPLELKFHKMGCSHNKINKSPYQRLIYKQKILNTIFFYR
jgi:hypothetical protein